MTREARFGLGLLALLLLLAVVGPWLAPDPNVMPDLANGTLLRPGTGHWLGTDQHSRDVFARLAEGARVSLGVGIVAVLVACGLGIIIGLVGGASEHLGARLVGRLIDLGLALPRVIVLMVLLAGVGVLPLWVFAVILGATGWAPIARLVRGETLRLRHAPFVLAARALGASPIRVLGREILPGTLAPVFVAATLGIADAMLLEAGLSFFGLGVRPPAPSWGGMLFEARPYLTTAPWLAAAPGAALVVATSAATLLGDALRRVFQPDAP
jgi:peptide/nickel transport system permease protein